MDRSRRDERGVILVVVLILAVTFSALSVALLSTAEMSLRVQGNGQDLERADRAARSGVEWAAAIVKSGGIVDVSRRAELTPGVVVAAQVRSAQTPNLLGGGSAYGAVVRVGADAAVVAAPFPHALLSFSTTSSLTDEMTVVGSAYLGDSASPPAISAARPAQMDGDLELVTTTALAANRVVHKSGVDRYGVTALTPPPWNTLPFTLGVGWTVPVTTYTGTTTVSGKTLSGIVVVNLLPTQTLTLDNCTIIGTLVVPSLYPPVGETLGVPTIQVNGSVQIRGGTADTGNLAILAPGCTLVGIRNGSAIVEGVTYVREAKTLDGTTFRGQMLVRLGITSSSAGAFRVERPGTFVPTVPVGITWTGTSGVRLTWRGRQ